MRPGCGCRRIPAAATSQATIERVLGELSIEQQASTRIDRLSGGERKRTAVASELLTARECCSWTSRPQGSTRSSSPS